MDASTTQSGSKGSSSDFSIERILGDRKDSREESAEVPEWLCCTRYRPPRLPRAATVGRARRAGRHARVPFTAAQAAALEAAYARAPYLAPPALRALAAALQLRDDRIKIWFQNRRARERREKSAFIAPPQGVTLAPTSLSSGFPENTWLRQANFSIIPNAQAFNSQRFEGPRNSVASNMCTIPLNCAEGFEDQCSYVSLKDHVDEDRPGTPLDIESVED